MLNNKAVQKLLTSKPVTISVHSMIMTALMTNKNKPNVMMVTGKVNKTKIGLMKILSNPKTTATIIEVPKLSTRTPGRK